MKSASVDLDVIARRWVTATILDIIYIMVGEISAELPIKLFYTPNHVEEFGHAFIRDVPTEHKDMYQES